MSLSQLAQTMVSNIQSAYGQTLNDTKFYSSVAPAIQEFPWNYVAQSSAFIASLGNFYFLSGGSFSITLPDASATGSTGAVIGLRHAGTSLSQVYTINTTSSQTINGSNGSIASGGFALYTTGEKLWLMSDGTNWQIIDHYAETGWASYTPTGSLTTNATYSGFWKRRASECLGIVSMTLSGAANSTGSFTFTLPSNIAVNSSVLPNAVTQNIVMGNQGILCPSGGAQYLCGAYYVLNSGNATSLAVGSLTSLSSFSSTQYPSAAAPNSSGPIPSSWSANGFYTVGFTIPALGWQP